MSCTDIVHDRYVSVSQLATDDFHEGGVYSSGIRIICELPDDEACNTVKLPRQEKILKHPVHGICCLVHVFQEEDCSVRVQLIGRPLKAVDERKVSADKPALRHPLATVAVRGRDEFPWTSRQGFPKRTYAFPVAPDMPQHMPMDAF